jgi:hypothetical protein
LNKKIVVIAISVAIIIGIIGMATDGFVTQNSKKNLPLIPENNTKTPLILQNNTKITSPVPTRHNIEINLNESMHFSAH